MRKSLLGIALVLLVLALFGGTARAQCGAVGVNAFAFNPFLAPRVIVAQPPAVLFGANFSALDSFALNEQRGRFGRVRQRNVRATGNAAAIAAANARAPRRGRR